MDKYIQAFIRTKVHVDAGRRVWCDGKQLETYTINGVDKVILPVTKQPFTFDDLKRAGARVDVITLPILAQQGAEGRWRENIDQRRKIGLPSNVYVANARSIELAIKRGDIPPRATYVGRKRDKITEVFDNVDDVVKAIAEDRWRTSFSKGRFAKKRAKPE